MRLWENIRDLTLHSVAPALIYEEEDLVKRAIRDMYDKDLEGIVVEGENGYREAKEFMRMLMPSQAKKIQAYREPTPLFIKARVEDTLAQIYNPVVALRSGGYLVINQTEALVAIDVNSGKATRERNIEATALKTNMEAAEEAARQMRLRDLAGLIVIDFIDMEEAKNNRAVEKKIKDSLKDDRARIQMGKISQFGLMEISRQRRRAGVLEGTTHVCPHCQGMGRVRSVESSALSMLRSVEVEAAKNGPGVIHLRVPSAVALYILNEKRTYLVRLQQQGLTVNVLVDDNLADVDHEIERISTLSGEEARAFVAPALPEPEEEEPDVVDEAEEEEDEEEEDEVEIEEEDTDDDEASARRSGPASREPHEGREEGGRGGRRRRRRRGGRRDDLDERKPEGEAHEATDAAAEPEGEADGEDDEGDDRNGRRRRRRGRRGGRRAREEVRTADPYGWVRVRVPHVDGVYSWYDPALAMPQGRAPESQARAEQRPEPAPTQPAVDPAPAAASDADIWVELPAVEDRPSRSRRGRGRGRGREAAPVDVAEAAVIEASEPELVVEAAAIVEPAPVAEPAPEPQAAPKRSRSRKKVPAPETAEEPAIAVAEPVAVVETVAEVAPEPVAPEPVARAPVAPEPVAAAPEPDPNEISTAPAQPKRGWWRR